LTRAAVQYARIATVALLAVAYAALAYYTSVTPGMQSLGAMVALTPLMLALVSIAWHARNRVAWMGATALVCTGLAFQWGAITNHYDYLYWLEHAGTEAFLGVVFLRSLQPGREAMCSYFARMVHGSLTPVLERYTRQITIAWVMFFFAMSSISSVLFFTATISAWSTFAYFFTAPLTIGMFVIEYMVRRRVLPDMEHAHIFDGIRAFWKSAA
jgi:uncharacterized membrane protein